MSNREESLAFIELIKEVKKERDIPNSKLAKAIGVHASSLYHWLSEPPTTTPQVSKLEGYIENLQNFLEGKDEVRYEVDNFGCVVNIQESDIQKFIFRLVDKRDKVISEKESIALEIAALKERLEQLERKDERYSHAIESLRELED